MESELHRVVDALTGWIASAIADGHIDFLSHCWREYTPELERSRSIRAAGKSRVMDARPLHLDQEHCWFLHRACPLADALEQAVGRSSLQDNRVTAQVSSGDHR